MKFFDEIHAEVAHAVEAEHYAASWKKEAASHIKRAKMLISAAKEIDPSAANVDPKTLIDQIRATLIDTPEESPVSDQETKAPEAPAEPEAATSDEPADEEPVYHEIPQTPSQP